MTLGRNIEKETLEVIFGLYCDNHHRKVNTEAPLCPDCATLLDYALLRLSQCPHGPRKPNCSDCSIHCYQPAHREQIRIIMRKTGYRLLWHRPSLLFRHLLKSFLK